MIKFRKMIAVTLSVLVILSMAMISGVNLSVKAAVKPADDIQSQIDDPSKKVIVVRSTMNIKELDIHLAIKALSREGLGRTLKLVGNFTFNGAMSIDDGSRLDATEAVVNVKGYAVMESYNSSNITIKGGVWNLDPESKFIHFNNGNNVVLDSVQINGGKNESTGIITIYNTQNVTIKNCKITGAESQALFVHNSKNVTIVNNTFNKINGHGINVYGSSNINSYKNKVNEIKGDGIKYCSTKNSTVSGNTVVNVKRHPELDIDPLRELSRSGCGMLISDCSDIKVGASAVFEGSKYSGNSFTDCENYGMHINLSKNTNVSRCSFTGTGSDGIHNSASAYTTVSSCTFKNSGDKAIFFIPGPVSSVDQELQDCKGSVLSDNTIEGCVSCGIMLSKVKEISLQNNSIKDCGDYAIYCNICENIDIEEGETSGTKTVNGSSVGRKECKNIRLAAAPTFDKSSITLGKGESFTLKCSNSTVTWSSTDSKVAEVSNGKITAKGTGTAVISATAFGGKSARCTVTVRNAPSKVDISQKTLTIGVGESYNLSAVLPSGTAAASRTFRTSSSAVVKMNTTNWIGSFVGVKPGTAWITVKLYNGKEASCKVTVKKAPSKVDISQKTLTIGVGESYNLSAVLPSETAAASRTFRTSSSAVAKMTKTSWTGSFVGVKPGTVWITVRLYNGKEASCKVTVKKAPTWVSLGKSSMTMKVGETASLSAIIAKDAGCAARTYRTSNSSIVKMTKTNWTGSFKAVKPGTAWVTVRLYNGKESSCKIVVSG